MAEPLKNMFNCESLGAFGAAIKAAYGDFDAVGFVAAVMGEGWEALELKARGRKISCTLGDFLPRDYECALGVLDALRGNYQGPCLFCLPDFVEVFGVGDGDLEPSLAALARYTPHASAEFAIRPLIVRHPARVMAQMLAWADSENEHLRRLASEGCRPQLPWGMALTAFKADPAPVLPILERLCDDSSHYVRNSVANNLNDISKTHPELVLDIAKRWQGHSERTDWIIKHACRTLLKKGNREALALFGCDDAAAVEVSDFALGAERVAIGGELTFSFTIYAKSVVKARLEYAVDYVKANGKQSRKVFQISEILLKQGEHRDYQKRISFVDLSTRKHYPGTHALALIVNGQERGKVTFEVGAITPKEL